MKLQQSAKNIGRHVLDKRTPFITILGQTFSASRKQPSVVHSTKIYETVTLYCAYIYLFICCESLMYTVVRE